MTCRLITLFAFALLAWSSTVSAQFLNPPDPWVTPTGMPTPSFGITQRPPAAPATWPSAQTPGFYYVDRTSAAATDSGNTYGYPARPRQTVPTTLTGPAYVEVHGTGYTLGSNPRYNFTGTLAAPVWLVGVGQPTFTGSESDVQFIGRYFVVEGLRFVNAKLVLGDYSAGGSAFAAIRHCEITGSTSDSGAMISMTGGAENLVFFNNLIHDNGPIDSGAEADLHGLKISSDTQAHHIWYVDNHSYRNSGDSVQFGSASPSVTNWSNNLFIGRNLMHQDRENACDLKAVRDVIISDNVMYGYAANSSAGGEACAAHNGTERVWIVNNEVYNSYRGITSTGADGFYVIGNLIHGINEPGFSATSLSNGHAVMTRATTNIVVIGNTIQGANHGIGIDGNSSAQVVNNIIADISGSGHSIGWANTSAFGGSLVKNNLFSGGMRVTVGSTAYTSLGALEDGANRSGSKVGTAGFIAPPSNYHLSANSPAVDSGYSAGGAPHPVYAQFQSRYPSFGTLRVDFDGNPRPASPAAWDLGAFEGASGDPSSGTPPASPTGLRITAS